MGHRDGTQDSRTDIPPRAGGRGEVEEGRAAQRGGGVAAHCGGDGGDRGARGGMIRGALFCVVSTYSPALFHVACRSNYMRYTVRCDEKMTRALLAIASDRAA